MRGIPLKMTALVAMLLLLSGCKTLSLLQDGKASALQDTLKAYQATVRWGYPGQMYNFLHPDIAAANPIPAGLANISVTNYKVIRLPVKVAENRATQTAMIGYLFDDRQVEKSLTDQQLWEYDEESESWKRINPIPEYQ